MFPCWSILAVQLWQIRELWFSGLAKSRRRGNYAKNKEFLERLPNFALFFLSFSLWFFVFVGLWKHRVGFLSWMVYTDDFAYENAEFFC